MFCKDEIVRVNVLIRTENAGIRILGWSVEEWMF
jgi:hypothetical protein